MKKEISSVNNRKGAFWYSSLCSDSSSHRVSAFHSRSTTKTILVKFANWYLETYRGLWWKRKYLTLKNWKEAFWETAVCSVNTSHRAIAFHCRSLSLRLFLWNLQSDISNPVGGYGEKKKNLPLKTVKELSEKMSCVLLIHLTEIHLSPTEAFG